MSMLLRFNLCYVFEEPLYCLESCVGCFCAFYADFKVYWLVRDWSFVQQLLWYFNFTWFTLWDNEVL